MNHQKGSAAIWVIVLLIVIIIAGAAYWYVTQNQSQSTSVSTAELQTQQATRTPSQPSQTTQPQTTGQNTTTSQPSQTATNSASNNSVSFVVPSSITLTSGEMAQESGSTHSVSITLTSFTVADGDGPAEYCPNVVLSNGVAADRTVMICADNPNYLPVLYGDLSILLTNASAKQATFIISATNNAPSASIDSSSLTSSSANPTVTGSAFNLQGVVVQIHANGHVYDAGNDQVTGSVPVSNNRWTATFTQVALSPGTYPISIIESEDQYALATGTLTITAQ